MDQWECRRAQPSAFLLVSRSSAFWWAHCVTAWDMKGVGLKRRRRLHVSRAGPGSRLSRLNPMTRKIQTDPLPIAPTMKFPLDPSPEEGREGTEPAPDTSGAQAKRSDRNGHDASRYRELRFDVGIPLAACPLRSRRRPEPHGDTSGDSLAHPPVYPNRIAQRFIYALLQILRAAPTLPRPAQFRYPEI